MDYHIVQKRNALSDPCSHPSSSEMIIYRKERTLSSAYSFIVVKWISMCFSILSLPVSLCLCLSVYLFVCPSVYLSVYLSMCLPSTRLPLSPSSSLCFCPTLWVFAPLLSLSLCECVCVCVSLSITRPILLSLSWHTCSMHRLRLGNPAAQGSQAPR